MSCYFKIKDVKVVSLMIKETFAIDLSDFTLVLLKLRYEQFCVEHKVLNVEVFINNLNLSKDLQNELLAFIFRNEFELFRDPALWRSLKEEVLPSFTRDIQYRVWIPSCFEGSELLSFLILRAEMGMVNKLQVIYTTPIENLNRAKIGFAYDERKYAQNLSNYKRIDGVDLDEKYFQNKSNMLVPINSLFDNTVYKEFCEVKNGILNKNVNLVLYRNRLLRYNKNLQKVVCDNLLSSLKVGGFLTLGIKENLPIENSMGKFRVFNKKESIYKKI